MDYKAMINNIMVGSIEKTNPEAAEMFKIFQKHGVDALTAFNILLELAAAFGQKGSKKK